MERVTREMADKFERFGFLTRVNCDRARYGFENMCGYNGLLNKSLRKFEEFDEEMTYAAYSLADKYELKYSGGSDFHGEAKPGIHLGTGRGNLYVPYAFYEDLKACSYFDDET